MIVRNKKKSEGQSTIEFLTTLIFVIGIIFFYVKMSLSMTSGFLVHYATFISSRAYLVKDTNSNEPNGSDGAAKALAQQVFNDFNLENIIPNFAPTFSVSDPEGNNNKVFNGVFVEYDAPFSISNLFGGKESARYVSESFLGREPTRAECLQQVCKAIDDLGASCTLHTTVFDNGC
jgi:hypothetical protein